MKALQISSYGDNSVLELKTDVPTPSISPDQILVEVHAGSINPFDTYVRSGMVKDSMPLTLPATVGENYAGVVKEVGVNVSGFSIGDEVYGRSSALNGSSGAFAEVAAANIEGAAKKPKNIDFLEAAALPLVGSSAVQALEDHIKLQKDQKILIHGGAGGIGHIAIQLAKAMGAYVATTVSADDKDFVKELGADEVIDYKTEDFSEILKDFDAVYSTARGDVVEKSFKVLKKGGVLVSMTGQPDENMAKEHGVTAIGQGTKTNTEHLDRVRELVEGGKIAVHIDKVFPFEKAVDAWEYQEKGHPRGKVVIQIK